MDHTTSDLGFDWTQVIHFDHNQLDPKCVLIWSKLWPLLQKLEFGSGAGANHEELPAVLCKVLQHYSSVHQLHRCLTKFLEALRKDVEVSESAEVFPSIFYAEIRRSFTNASEQTLSNILSVLTKEVVSYLQADDLCSKKKLKTIVRLLWLLLKHFSIKSTTRQEIIQNVGRQYLQMRIDLLDPLLTLCGNSDSDELLFSCCVLVHAWMDFALVLKDKIDLPVDDGDQLIKKSLRLAEVNDSVYYTCYITWW